MSEPAVEQAVQAVQWEPLLLAVALLVGSAALLILEFFVVSFGVLLASALALLAAAIYFAFQASAIVGWVFVVAAPVLGYAITRWGITRVQRSRLVPKSAISADAGYHHLTTRFGIEPGSRGEMVTPGFPSGRARFEGGEVDVQAVSGSLQRGTGVRVQRIEGPVVYVVPVTAEESEGKRHDN